MKRVFFNLILLTGILFSVPARANLNQFIIDFVVAWGETDTECGVQGHIDSIEGGIINGSERLAVNGITWGDFAGLPMDGYQPGTPIAFGTQDLQIRTALAFDINLDTGICQNIQEGDSLEFFGSFGGLLDEVPMPDPVIRRALALSIDRERIVDLSTESVTFTNRNGAQATVGEGPPADEEEEGHGCSLAIRPFNGNVVCILALAPLVLLVWRRGFVA